jgi:hypothetical protein
LVHDAPLVISADAVSMRRHRIVDKSTSVSFDGTQLASLNCERDHIPDRRSTTVKFKALGGAAALALQQPSTWRRPSRAVLCEDLNLNHMLVDSAYVQSCIDAASAYRQRPNDDFGTREHGWRTSRADASFISLLASGSIGHFLVRLVAVGQQRLDRDRLQVRHRQPAG